MKYYRQFILLLAVLLVIIGCRKEQTSWDTNWVFPVVKDTLTISQFYNDSILEVNADNSIQFVLRRDIFDIDLFSLIDIPDTTIVQTFSIAFASLSLAPGTEYVNQTEEHYFELEDAVLFKTRTKTGQALITVENPVETATIFEVELPGVTKNGAVFTQTEIVPAAQGNSPGVRSFVLDLTGYTIDMRGENGNSYNTLQSKMKVRTDPNGPAVVITNSDIVKFNVKFQDLTFDYAKGYFGSVEITDTTQLDLEALQSVAGGSIALEGIDFNLILSNGIKVMGQGMITQLKSTNYSGATITLTHPQLNSYFNIDPAVASWSSITPFEYPIAFNEVNSNINPFLAHMGSSYEIGYGIKVNPWGNISAGADEIFPGSRLKLRFEADFPLAVGADNLIIIDTFAVDFGEQRNAFRVESGSFVLKTKNTFPLGGSAELILLDENGFSVGTIISSEQIDPAPMNMLVDAHEEVENELIFVVNESIVNELPAVREIVVKVRVNSTTLVNNQLYDNARMILQLLTNFKLKATL